MMRPFLVALTGWLAWFTSVPAQSLTPTHLPEAAPLPAELRLPESLPQPPPSPANPSPRSAPGQPGPDNRSLEEVRAELERNARELQRLQEQQGRVADAQEVERLRKQMDLLQKQIEVLQRIANLLAEQLKKNELQTTTLEARSLQAARRDQDVTQAVDDLRESADAERRTGPALPSTLRELFNPHRNNESPLGIYGTFATQFDKFEDRPSNFPSPVFSPHFYLLLNERFLLEVNPEFRATDVELESCQLDIFLHDNITAVVGRFYSPIGFFNERLHTSWIYKTPDRPLMFSQVYPASLSLNGAMLKGGVELPELWGGPVKLEYSGVVSNGFSLPADRPSARDFADHVGAMDSFNDVNGDKAFGGRIGLFLPALGLLGGISGLANGAYDRAEQLDLTLWDVDLSWRRGNWDYKFEYAQVDQDTPDVPIRRRGFYSQLAYRAFDSCYPVLQKSEAVLRYDYVRFRGIDLDATGLDFGARERIPIDRNRYTFGLNYYPYPSLIFRVAYEINDEVGTRERNDNGFIAQVSWGF